MAATKLQSEQMQRIITEIVYRLKEGDILTKTVYPSKTCYDYAGYAFCIESKSEQDFFMKMYNGLFGRF